MFPRNETGSASSCANVFWTPGEDVRHAVAASLTAAVAARYHRIESQAPPVVVQEPFCSHSQLAANNFPGSLALASAVSSDSGFQNRGSSHKPVKPSPPISELKAPPNPVVPLTTMMLSITAATSGTLDATHGILQEEPMTTSGQLLLCEHVDHWHHARSRRGHAYFVCKACGHRWRTGYEDSKRALRSSSLATNPQTVSPLIQASANPQTESLPISVVPPTASNTKISSYLSSTPPSVGYLSPSISSFTLGLGNEADFSQAQGTAEPSRFAWKCSPPHLVASATPTTWDNKLLLLA